MYYICEASERPRALWYFFYPNFSNMNEGQTKQSSLGVPSARCSGHLDRELLGLKCERACVCACRIVWAALKFVPWNSIQTQKSHCLCAIYSPHFNFSVCFSVCLFCPLHCMWFSSLHVCSHEVFVFNMSVVLLLEPEYTCVL